MKRTLLYSTLISTAIFSQLSFAVSPPENALIACDTSGNKCVAIGDVFFKENCSWWNGCYKIVSYVTSDGKKTWTETQSDQSYAQMQTLTAIKCNKNLDRCAVVGSENGGHDRMDHQGLILFTNNGGYHWISKAYRNAGNNICRIISPFWGDSLESVDTASNEKNWVAVGSCTSSSSTGVLMTGYSAISDDNGENWRYSMGQTLLDKTDFRLSNVNCNESTICRANGTILIEWPKTEPISFISNDFGDHWNRIIDPTQFLKERDGIHRYKPRSLPLS